MSFPSACMTTHVTPPPLFREHTCDSVQVMFSQGGQCLTHDPGQMLGPEMGLVEMPEAEYTNLQHLIQAHVEAQAAPPDGPYFRPHNDVVLCEDPTISTVISPLAPQAIDLSTSTDEHCLVMPGEQTPVSYGDVPGFVLARIRGEDSPTRPWANISSTSAQKRARSSARVCLETRFSTMSADTPRQPDFQSAFLSNLLTMIQQSAEAQEPVIHPPVQKWMKMDRGNPYDDSTPFRGDVFNPLNNTCEQVIGHIPHMVEPNKHQGLIPKVYSINFHQERIGTEGHYTSDSQSTEELVNTENVVPTPAASRKHNSTCTRTPQPIKPAQAAPDCAGRSGSSTKKKKERPHLSLSQRRERHNSIERQRRKKIRACCDELNMLVPFCGSGTDKVSTLQWTITFLRYINNTYGDTLKEEFKKTIFGDKGLFLKSSTSSGQDPIHLETDETLIIPLAVEQ